MEKSTGPTEWRELGSAEANDLFLRKPQLRAAELAVTAAEADVAASKLALERTVIRAPFDGRVLQKRADVGQFVGNGTPLAQVYAIEALELRLPVSDAQLALLPDSLTHIVRWFGWILRGCNGQYRRQGMEFLGTHRAIRG